MAPPVNSRATGSAVAQAPTLPWWMCLRDLTSAYLPLLLMALLALGTWWLVKNTPLFETPGAARAARHVPDYSMAQFKVQRYAKDGRMRAQIEGDVLRHYPDTDTIEIDNPRIEAFAPDGRITVATARRAVSNADGSEVQLLGGAHVVQAAVGRDEALDFRGEFLHAFFVTDELRSHLPVVVRRGSTELRADGLNYRHGDQRLQLNGRVRATFPPVVQPRAAVP